MGESDVLKEHWLHEEAIKKLEKHYGATVQEIMDHQDHFNEFVLKSVKNLLIERERLLTLIWKDRGNVVPLTKRVKV